MSLNAPESPESVWQYAAENLRRHKTSGIYYAFIKRGRKQFRRSLKTNDKALAKRKLADLLRDVDRLASAEAAHATFDEVAARWIETTRHALKVGTIRHRQTCLKAVAPFFRGQSIRNVTPRHCEAWVAERDTDKFRHCPALAVFGQRSCGKTALIDLVLTPLFGGRKSDPMNYLREPKFNKDLFAASLLVLDDKGASANLAERRQRGEGIKDLIWKPEQRMEGKGVDAVNLRPFWRLVIAGNDDDAGLQVCPALSPSLEDKLLILCARQAEGLPATHEENDAWAARIRAELPAFAAYLLAWRPPESVTLDARTRVANFWHPQIVSTLRELQPEMRLLELIDTLGLMDSDAPLWEGTATEFEKAMRARDEEGILDRIFTSGTSAGRMLTELSRAIPDRVKRTSRDGRSHYRIFRVK